MHLSKTKSLLATLACALLIGFGITGCATAHQAVDKTGRVLAHGERKLERHLPD